MSHLHTPSDDRIFVFGSNMHGMHGGGAARYALTLLQAEWGVHEGITGRTYALPTCDVPGVPLSLLQVSFYVKRFMAHASGHPEIRFFVSEIGCGLAGFNERDVIPLFRGAPTNCDLPPGWRDGPVCDARLCRNIGTRHWDDGHEMG